MKFIIAGNYNQASSWAAEHQLLPHTWKYVDSPETLYGSQRGSQVLIVGTWSEHNQISRILEVMMERGIAWKHAK